MVQAVLKLHVIYTNLCTRIKRLDKCNHSIFLIIFLFVEFTDYSKNQNNTFQFSAIRRKVNN